MERLDRRLRALYPDLSWARIRQAIERGQVTVDGTLARDPGVTLPLSAAIDWDPARRALPHARLDLPRLYEDDEILVIDKPAGLLTIATDAMRRSAEDTVLGRVQEYAKHLHGRGSYAGVLHRLDRDTSGALALALSRSAHVLGRELFATHRFERRYLAIVEGILAPAAGTIDAPVSRVYADGRRRIARSDDEGRRAVTHYRVREVFEHASLVELRLETGRQHQIRLHLQQLGHPLVGEQVYGGTGRTGGKGRARRQMLHAWRLRFPHPLRDRVIDVEAPLPNDFERWLRRLRQQ